MNQSHIAFPVTKMISENRHANATASQAPAASSRPRAAMASWVWGSCRIGQAFMSARLHRHTLLLWCWGQGWETAETLQRTRRARHKTLDAGKRSPRRSSGRSDGTRKVVALILNPRLHAGQRIKTPADTSTRPRHCCPTTVVELPPRPANASGTTNPRVWVDPRS